MRPIAVAFACGLVFALGLGIAGMTDPQKIIDFLNVTGRWDPSLAFVMLGAVSVYLVAGRWAAKAARPLWAAAFAFPTRERIDARLVLGAALFGVGWGASGYCPGPALVDLAAPSPSLVTFVLAMLAGVLAFRLPRLLPTARRPDATHA